MCVIFNQKSKVKVGYKMVAINKEKEVFSSFTGQELTIGKVPLPPTWCKIISSGWNSMLKNNQLKTLGFYNENYAGKTSIFLKLVDAKAFLSIHKSMDPNYELIIVKIKFDSDVFLGEYYVSDYGFCKIIAGNSIKSITLL